MADDTFKQQIRDANAKNARDPLGIKEAREARASRRTEVLVNDKERITILTDARGIIGSIAPGEDGSLRLTENAPLTEEQRQELLDRWNEQFGVKPKKAPICECGHSLQGHDPTKAECLVKSCGCGLFRMSWREDTDRVNRLAEEIIATTGIRGYLTAFPDPESKMQATIDIVEVSNKEGAKEIAQRINFLLAKEGEPCAVCGHPYFEHNRREVGFLKQILFCDDQLCSCSGFEVRKVEEVEKAFGADKSIDNRRNVLVEEIGRGYLARQVPLEISQKAVELIDAATKERDATRMRAVSQAERMFYATTSSIVNLENTINDARSVIDQALAEVRDNPIATGRVNRIKTLLDGWNDATAKTKAKLKQDMDSIRSSTQNIKDT